MSVTERKYCDICDKIALFTKDDPDNDVGEECLYCGWKNWKDEWNEEAETKGFEQAKATWIDCRDSDLNKQIVKEMNVSERIKWDRIVRWTNKKFGLEKKEDDWKDEQDQQKPFDYKPWLIGGGIGILLGILVGLLINKSNRSRD